MSIAPIFIFSSNQHLRRLFSAACARLGFMWLVLRWIITNNHVAGMAFGISDETRLLL